MAQQVKDLALSLLWLKFDPWPGKFHMLWVQQKKKKKDEFFKVFGFTHSMQKFQGQGYNQSCCRNNAM